MENSLKKIQSPPPKPPRRRHSDQPSLSPAGTMPNCKNNSILKSQLNSAQLPFGQSDTCCESLPSEWIDEINLEKKIAFPCAFQEKNCLNWDLKESLLCISNSDDVGMPKNKISSCGSLLNELNNPNLKKKEFSVHHALNSEGMSSNCVSRNVSKSFPTCLPEFNLTKYVSKEDVKHFKSASFSKRYHRRHNSDPLPSSHLNKCPTSFLSPLLINKSNKLNQSEYMSESNENYYLLQEIKSLKEINYKLLEHLCCAQASLENLLNNSSGHLNAVCLSDLLLSLYDSLKAKDAAMENRIKLVLEERDNAIRDLDSMVQTVTRSLEDTYPAGEDNSSSDKEIKELLQEIKETHNPAKLLQQQKLLLSHLYRSKELKLDYMYHEMKLMVIERDNLQLKVQLLENELKQLQLSKEIYDTDNKCWESNLLNSLCQAIHQRDAILKRCNTSNLDFYMSRSSVYEMSTKMNDCSQSLEKTAVKKNNWSPENKLKMCNPLSLNTKSDELKFLKEEIFVLNESLETEFEKNEIAEKKCNRLNKLVKVLQKKLNGQNIGIPV